MTESTIINAPVYIIQKSDLILLNFDCHATARDSIPGGNGVKTELHILCKGLYMGVPSLNDLPVDGT